MAGIKSYSTLVLVRLPSKVTQRYLTRELSIIYASFSAFSERATLSMPRSPAPVRIKVPRSGVASKNTPKHRITAPRSLVKKYHGMGGKFFGAGDTPDMVLGCEARAQCTSPATLTSMDLNSWAVGLIDGEGCFFIRCSPTGKHIACCMTVQLRADDAPTIRKLQATLGGIGRLRFGAPPSAQHRNIKPHCGLFVSCKADAQQLRTFLQEHPLQSKKAQDAELWMQAAYLHSQYRSNKVNDISVILELKYKLARVREYDPKHYLEGRHE